MGAGELKVGTPLLFEVVCKGFNPPRYLELRFRSERVTARVVAPASPHPHHTVQGRAEAPYRYPA